MRPGASARLRPRPSAAATAPPTASSQKWFPWTTMTPSTTSGYSAPNARAHAGRASARRSRPRSAQTPCGRSGTRRTGSAPSRRARAASAPSGSPSPGSPSSRGGAVGSARYPRRPPPGWPGTRRARGRSAPGARATPHERAHGRGHVHPDVEQHRRVHEPGHPQRPAVEGGLDPQAERALGLEQLAPAGHGGRRVLGRGQRDERAHGERERHERGVAPCPAPRPPRGCRAGLHPRSLPGPGQNRARRASPSGGRS
jgi:hypothetical protein